MVGAGLPLDELELLGVALPQHEDGPGGEEAGHQRLDGPVGQQVDEPDPDGGGDHHVDAEGAGGAQPHGPGVASRRHHDGGEHRLVGKLADEDDREDRSDDRRVHGLLETGDGPSRIVSGTRLARLGPG